MFGRYFYFESNGSDIDVWNHLAEVEIIDKKGVNRALGRGLSKYPSTSSGNSSWVTNGNTSLSEYVQFGEGKQYVVIDLGAVYDITQVKVWRYYDDARCYKDVYVKISLDDVEYTTIFSSKVNGTYPETSEGYQIDIPPGRNGKWLICSQSIYYTIENDLLVELSTSELSSQTFQDYGMDLTPEWDKISSLENPEILYWQSSADDYMHPITVDMIATPFTQVIISDKIDMSHHTIKGIESVTVDCDGSPLIAVSFDDKATWIAFDGTQWVTLSSEFTGMTKETVESIPVEQWASVRGDVVEMYIRVVLSTTDQVVRQIYVDFLN